MSKILIVSHNCLSLKTNNGKTLMSFVKNVKDTNLSQIIINNEIPDSSSPGCQYFSYSRMQKIDINKDVQNNSSKVHKYKIYKLFLAKYLTL